MGGGKGGSHGPIYNPSSTPILEGAIAGQSLGSALGSNPALQPLLNTPESRQRLQAIGLSPEMIQQMSQQGQGQKVDYDSLLSQAQGLPTGPVSTSVQWHPGQATQFTPPPSEAFQYKAPGSSFQFQTPSNPYQFQGPNYQTSQFQTKDISNAPDQAYDQSRNRAYEDITQQQKQSNDQSSRALASRGLGRSGLISGAQSENARTAMQNMSRASTDIGNQQAQSKIDVAKYNANQDFQRQQAQSQENKFQTQLDQWRQSSQAGENNTRAGFGLQTQQAQAGENLNRDQLGFQTQQAQADQIMKQFGLLSDTQSKQAAENLAQNQQLLAGQGQMFNQGATNQQNMFQNLLQQIGLSGSLQSQRYQQQQAPMQALQQLYSTNTGIPVVPGGGKGDPFSAILGAASTIAPLAMA